MAHAGDVEQFGLELLATKAAVVNIQDVSTAKIVRAGDQYEANLTRARNFLCVPIEDAIGLTGGTQPRGCVYRADPLVKVCTAVLNGSAEYFRLVAGMLNECESAGASVEKPCWERQKAHRTRRRLTSSRLVVLHDFIDHSFAAFIHSDDFVNRSVACHRDIHNVVAGIEHEVDRRVLIQHVLVDCDLGAFR